MANPNALHVQSPLVRRGERAGYFCLAVAISTAPAAGKLPLGLGAITACDALVGLAAVFLAPAALRQGVFRRIPDCLIWPLPFVAWAAVSAASAENGLLALKEFSQLAAYCLAGAWMFTRATTDRAWLRWVRFALRGAIIVGILGCFLRVLVPVSVFAALYGTRRGLACCLFLMTTACIADLVSFQEKNGRVCRGVAYWTILLLGVVVLYWPLGPGAPAPSASSAPTTAIPQRYLEGYAALSVLAEQPVTGVGLGNYQRHIGKYYQGMPKANTIAPGTQMGYAVLLASTGIPGLGAYIYWLAQMWCGNKGNRRLGPYRRLPLAGLILCGILTPINVGYILIMLVLLHGLAQAGTNEYA